MADSVARSIVKYITITDSVTLSDVLSVLTGLTRSVVAYLTQRTASGGMSARSGDSSLLKRTAEIRTEDT